MSPTKKRISYACIATAAAVAWFGSRGSNPTPAAGQLLSQLPESLSALPDTSPTKPRLLNPETMPDAVVHEEPLVLANGQKLDLAMDRIYVRGNGHGRCFETFTPVSTLAELEAKRSARALETGKSVTMVGFLHGQPKNQDTLRTISDRILVKTNDKENCIKLAESLGLDFMHVSPSHQSYLVFRAKDRNPLSAVRQASAIAKSDSVLIAQMNLGLIVRKCATVNDPLYPHQWHLKNTGQDNSTPGVDANIEPAWDMATGTGIVIGINDDGMQLAHPDLFPNLASFHIDMSKSTLVFNGDGSLNEGASVIVEDTTPANNEEDHHGTSVGGVAAARGNNKIGVSGAAPFAKLSGLRFLNIVNDNVTDIEEIALTSTFRAVDTHIKNNSWGGNTVSWFTDASGLVLDALESSGTTGRNGKGTIHTYAAGNSRENNNQAIKSGMLNSPFVIPIAAMNNRGGHSSYSDYGSMIVVSAPSSSVSANGIVTTDRTGVQGYNSLDVPGEDSNNDYTRYFGGTSSATPLVSGVIALMLEVNPNLSYRDIKEILLRTSVRTDLDPRGWVERDGLRPDMPQIKHHNSYGGGRVDAAAAVTMARDWTLLPALAAESQKTVVLPAELVLEKFSSNSDQGAVTTLNFDMTAEPLLRVEHVFVDFPYVYDEEEDEFIPGLSMENVPDLSLILTAPDGTESELHLADQELSNEGAEEDVPLGFYFTTVRHWGAQNRGVWKLRIADGGLNFDVVTLNSARVRVVGTPLSEDQTRKIVITGPADFDFGTQDVGNDHVRSFSITNNGGLDFHVTNVSFSNPAFTGSFSGVVPAGATRNFDVTFSPTDAVSYTGTMLVASTATEGTSFATIKGAGQVVPAPTLTTPTSLAYRSSSAVTLPIDSIHAVSFTAKGLPKGLVIHPTTGQITGSATKPGTYNVTVSAKNPWGVTAISFALIIEPFATLLHGSYTADVSRSSEINGDLGGILRINVSSSGAYTGSLKLGTQTFSLKGFVGGTTDSNPKLDRILVDRSGFSYRLELEFMPDQTVTGDIFLGQLITPISASVNGWRNGWLAASTFPNAGIFNHRLSLDVTHVGDATIPQGHGFYSQKITTKGVATVTGTTSDGQKFTSAGDIGTSGDYTVWSLIHRAQGVIQDRGVITATTATGTGYFIKTPYEASTSRLYAPGFGFLTEVNLDSSGGLFTAPSAVQAFLSKVPGTNNAAIDFTHAGISSSVTNPDMTLSLGAGGTVTVPAAGAPLNPAKIKLSINKKTGAVTGDMTITDPNPLIFGTNYSRKVRFVGLIDPSTNKAYGYFILNQLPPLIGLPIPINQTTLLSGEWVLQ